MGGESLTSLQIVVVAIGEGTFIFFTWQISNIMHCQIILNTTAVTRRPCSQYLDLLWLINPAATTCHWTINHDDLHPHPSSLTLLHLSAHLNMRWRLNGSQKISLWDSTAWQRCLHVREIWLRNTHGCASGCDAHFSPQMEAISRNVYTVCGAARHLVKFESNFATIFEQHLYKFPWQTRRLEMKGLTMFAPVWWDEQTLIENIKRWQSLPILLSLPFNNSLFRHPL